LLIVDNLLVGIWLVFCSLYVVSDWQRIVCQFLVVVKVPFIIVPIFSLLFLDVEALKLISINVLILAWRGARKAAIPPRSNVHYLLLRHDRADG
jgi:hypothetical protein